MKDLPGVILEKEPNRFMLFLHFFDVSSITSFWTRYSRSHDFLHFIHYARNFPNFQETCFLETITDRERKIKFVRFKEYQEEVSDWMRNTALRFAEMSYKFLQELEGIDFDAIWDVIPRLQSSAIFQEKMHNIFGKNCAWHVHGHIGMNLVYTFNQFFGITSHMDENGIGVILFKNVDDQGRVTKIEYLKARMLEDGDYELV